MLVTIVIGILALVSLGAFLVGTAKKNYKDYKGDEVSIRIPAFIVGGVALVLTIIVGFFSY